jgi:FAD/FMN-containing dehydrogenase
MIGPIMGGGARWENWYGNVACEPRQILRPENEQELAEAVRGAGQAGEKVRVAGAGHSNVPLVSTGGTLLLLEGMAGVTAVDRERKTATVAPGTRIAELGDVLWEHGLGLINQGDIDTQQIAGALTTGTHGTGAELPNFGGSLLGARLVTADGAVLEAGPDNARLLDALRTSLGLLGAISELTLAVRDAYCIERTWLTMSWEEFGERWPELLATNRHFTFFWNEYDDSAALFGLPPSPAQSVLVKLMNPLPADAEPRGSGAHDDPEPQVERSYRVFADEYDPYFAELEYLIPVEQTIAAMDDIRTLIRESHPDQRWAVEVRFTAGDPGWLSPAHERQSCVISCCGDYRESYEPYLRDCDRVLANYDARPHWGKMSFFDRERLERVFPKLPDFRRLRQELDPGDVFLNDWLRPVAGGADA